MNVDKIKAIIDSKPNLSTALGMEFISTPEGDTCMARMKVDERNRQPFGFLSGGASLALAENDTVTAYARLLHQGTTLHVWNVDIKDTAGDLISNVRVTNYVMKQK